MDNIIDYAEKVLDTMVTAPFGPVDSLVLSQFAYIRFEDVVPGLYDGAPSVRIKDLLKAEHYPTMFKNVRDPENNRRLLTALAASPRFRDVRMNYYVAKTDIGLEHQFSAVTFGLGDKVAYIAFRGTDGTVVGWKEDFNMGFKSPVPSQEEGVRFLNEVGKRYPETAIRVGGHSKGGNIAVYAAMHCDAAVKNRIQRVFSHDGPGFRNEVLESGDFARLEPTLHKTVPQSSLIGMLMHNQERHYVVESNRFGIMQHDPFSWVVDGRDFRYAVRLSDSARYFDRTLNGWLNTQTDEKRALFVDVLFSAVGSTNATTVAELREGAWYKGALSMIKAYKSADEETRQMLMQAVKSLAVALATNFRSPGKRFPTLSAGTHKRTLK